MTDLTNILRQIQKKAERAEIDKDDTKSALHWYSKKSKFFHRLPIKDEQIFYENERWRDIHSDVIGDMIMFKYDAKHKEKLPYWDELPLVIPVMVTPKLPGRMLGLNLHYLPPRERSELFYALLKFKETEGDLDDDSYTDRTKMIILYRVLKHYSRAKAYKACIKQYRYSNIRSKLIYIHPSEWHSAIFLPTRRWIGNVDESDIWKDSLEKINE